MARRQLPLPVLAGPPLSGIRAQDSRRRDLPYLLPVRNCITGLIEKAGLFPARDFALGVLAEGVRQEEDGWPDQQATHAARSSGCAERLGCQAGRLFVVRVKKHVPLPPLAAAVPGAALANTDRE